MGVSHICKSLSPAEGEEQLPGVRKAGPGRWGGLLEVQEIPTLPSDNFVSVTAKVQNGDSSILPTLGFLYHLLESLFL